MSPAASHRISVRFETPRCLAASDAVKKEESFINALGLFCVLNAGNFVKALAGIKWVPYESSCEAIFPDFTHR
jgi:hypothetical protein